MARIGIRREDKSKWEARVPLIPADVDNLIRDEGLRFTVQTSPIRTFPDGDYSGIGATVADDLTRCPVIMGVKEIPLECFEAGKAYVFFSHTIKGQSENMPALKRMMELGCTLIDYEKITDEQGRRLVFFGRYAGIAGMIDTLWALGRRLQHEGIDTVFEQVKPAHEYRDLEQVRKELGEIGEKIRRHGLPEAIKPLVVGFAGYGQVSIGAQEIYDLLSVKEIQPEELAGLDPAADICHKVVFHEKHMVARRDRTLPFKLQEYFDHPEHYAAAFFPHVEHLTALVNCIYWEPKYPRLFSRSQFQELYSGGQPRLRVVGDITCDIDGSIACTTRTTDPSDPVYVYDPKTGEAQTGIEGSGPVVLAVDFLPCEVPVAASSAFSEALTPFIPALARTDFSGPIAKSGLPAELERATIVYGGKLTERYRYLAKHLRQPSGSA